MSRVRKITSSKRKESSKNNLLKTALTSAQISRFRRTVYSYYHKNKRIFPWRQTTNPYHILVSEFMLQQTQTSRVISKYREFLNAFPDISTLARAPLRQVLTHCQWAMGFPQMTETSSFKPLRATKRATICRAASLPRRSNIRCPGPMV